ncbi:hypothetical protein SynPROSU1_02032 [Synechococcus sp. PROS-U-1]|nr:hypothetical protein SynPROSU1_02032 [Synechococcus sp. PROS-U-1]
MFTLIQSLLNAIYSQMEQECMWFLVKRRKTNSSSRIL